MLGPLLSVIATATIYTAAITPSIFLLPLLCSGLTGRMLPFTSVRYHPVQNRVIAVIQRPSDDAAFKFLARRGERRVALTQRDTLDAFSLKSLFRCFRVPRVITQ
jgi:hypothetical protein